MKRFGLLILLFSSVSLYSQSVEIGLSGGVAYYDGDIAPNKLHLYFKTLRPAYGAFVRFNVLPAFSLRMAYTHMTVMGDDAISKRNYRGLSFESDISEMSVNLELNLFRLHLFKDDFYVEGYLSGGPGFFRFDPLTVYKGQITRLQPVGTEGQGLPGYPPPYELNSWSVLVGGGVKLRMTENWILGFDFLGRITPIDYLDDVSNTRVVYKDVLEGNGYMAAALSRPTFNPEKDNASKPYYRGGKARDYYSTFGVNISYRFGVHFMGGDRRRSKEARCPTF